MWSWKVPPNEIYCTVDLTISSQPHQIRKDSCNFLSKYSFITVLYHSVCMVKDSIINLSQHFGPLIQATVES